MRRWLASGINTIVDSDLRASEDYHRMITTALNYAIRYGQIDGDHHKAWVIDQMVRALTACPITYSITIDRTGEATEHADQGESETYTKLIAWACDGEYGPDSYGWDIGIAP